MTKQAAVLRLLTDALATADAMLARPTLRVVRGGKKEKKE